MNRTGVSLTVLAAFAWSTAPQASAPWAAFAQASATQAGRVVNIQYMPGLSNAKKLKDPFAATYSTLYLLQGGGGHSLTFESDEGVILINAKEPGWGPAVFEKLGLITQEPVTTIVNTHPDPGYSGSNGEYPDVTRIIAHERARAAMARMPAFQGGGAKFLPNTTFTDRMSLLEGQGRNQIDLYHFGPGHTDGDTVVIIPTYSAAYLGELFPAKTLPVIDGANGGSALALPDTLERALAVMQAVDVDYVVGGRMPTVRGTALRVMSQKDVREYVAFNRAVITAVREAKQAGRSADDAAASLLRLLGDRFPGYDPGAHRDDYVRGLYAELP
ncbi:MAG: hypothetical protein FJW23_16380 [Acidimicrobiia bacterium]|nr:hypothetical protein [Acidimicrobiia bacterium]